VRPENFDGAERNPRATVLKNTRDDITILTLDFSKAFEYFADLKSGIHRDMPHVAAQPIPTPITTTIAQSIAMARARLHFSQFVAISEYPQNKVDIIANESGALCFSDVVPCKALRVA
jgi:hypothetical protein